MTNLFVVLALASTSRAEPARVTIETVDGRDIVVSEVLAQMNAQAFSNVGATAAMYGEIRQDLCVTPCTIDVEAGFHKLRFGAYNPMNANVPVNLNLAGDSTLRVRPFDGGKAVAGILMGILGGTALITGGTLAIVEDSGRGGMAGLAVVGAGAALGGVVLTNGARSRVVSHEVR